MRILHIAKYYEPFKGGIEKVILELASGSVRAGHEVVVLSSNHSTYYSEEEIEGVKVIRLPRFGTAFSQPLSPSFLYRAKKWMRWADVVQVHTPNPLAELSVLMQDVNTPVLLTYHCDVVKQKAMQKVYFPVAEKLLERANRITVSTPNHLKYSELLHPHKDKVDVIPFGVRAKHSERTLEINNAMKKIKDELGDYFLFIGRLVPYKGVDVLLHALKRVNEKLVILGQGPKWEDWYLLAQDLGLQEQVRLIGRVDDDHEFAAYMHGCQALVLPSLNEAEAFGIVLIEAMSCGKPIITTDLKSGVPWVNDKGVTGLEVPPNDAKALGSALHEMATDHEMRRNMGEAALKRFHSLFYVDKMVNAYLSLYEDMLDRKSIAA